MLEDLLFPSFFFFSYGEKKSTYNNAASVFESGL